MSFCWHPFVRVPNAPKRDWRLRWPACERVLVDERVIPTGVRVAQPAENEPLGDRARSTTTTRSAATAASRWPPAARSIEFRFGPTYPFAQLYVPPEGAFAAIEPMTATIDALGRGTAPLVAPGDRFRAWFSIAVSAGA